MSKPHLLILGGTGEGAALAEAAVTRFGTGLRVTSSLAGRTRNPRLPPGLIRIGGFGGAEGLAEFLRAEAVTMLVDATHPYADTISANARAACMAAGVERLMLVRPPWPRRAGDDWIPATGIADAAQILAEMGLRAFLALGANEVAAFRNLDGASVVLRLADPPAAAPIPGCTVTVGRGPFREADELALLQDNAIEIVVSRNSGGMATYPKIAAARKLGLSVIMIERPPTEGGDAVPDVARALAWIAARL